MIDFEKLISEISLTEEEEQSAFLMAKHVKRLAGRFPTSLAEISDDLALIGFLSSIGEDTPKNGSLHLDIPLLEDVRMTFRDTEEPTIDIVLYKRFPISKKLITTKHVLRKKDGTGCLSFTKAVFLQKYFDGFSVLTKEASNGDCE